MLQLPSDGFQKRKFRNSVSPLIWKYFFIFGLMSASWNSVWGIYNNYVPIYLQAGNPGYDLAGQGTSFGFGLTPFWAGIVMSMDNIIGLVLCILIGAYSDRIQKRSPFILFGVPLAIAGSLILPIVASSIQPETSGHLSSLILPFSIFLVCAASLSTGYFLTHPMTGAMVLDTIPSAQQTKAFSYILLFSGATSLLFYLVSGSLYNVNRILPFSLGAATLLAALITFKALIHEPKRVIKRDSQDRQTVRLGELFTDFRRLSFVEALSLVSMVLTIFFFQFGFAAFQTFASSYALNVLEMPEADTIVIILLFQTGFLLTTYWTHLISKRIGRKPTIRVGLLGNVLFPLLAFFFPYRLLIYSVFLIFGICFTLFYVNQIPVIGGVVTSGRMAGKLVGINSMTVSLSTLVAVPVSGWLIGLSGNNYNLLWLITAATMLAAFFLSFGVKGGEAQVEED